MLLLDARDQRDLRRAEDLGRQGRPAAALAIAQRLDRRPTSTRAAAVVAAALAAQGRWPEASRAYRRAVERSPSDWGLRVAWAVALERSGKVRSAVSQLARAQQLNPLQFAGPLER